MKNMMIRLLLPLVIVCIVLVGCGAKGGLYLPDQRYPQPQENK